MHYRNGREAKNGDLIVILSGGKIVSYGVLFGAVAGNDYCNGSVAPVQPTPAMACLCDALHIEDVATLLAEKGLDKTARGEVAMCVVSMISEHYMHKWPTFPPQAPVLPQEWHDYSELLRKAAEYDKLTGQPDCPDPQKVEWQEEFERFMKQRAGFQPKV